MFLITLKVELMNQNKYQTKKAGDLILNNFVHFFIEIPVSFLSIFGELIYYYEFRRKKDYLSDLSTFKLR